MSDEKNLSEDLNDMLGDAKEGAKKASDKAGELAGDAKEKVGELANDAKKTANEFSKGAREAFGGEGENKKVLVGILAILLGSLGVHKFILGYNKEGGILLAFSIVMYLLSCLAIGLLFVWIPAVVGLVEGIIYLTKTDEEFYNTYQVGKKPWF